MKRFYREAMVTQIDDGWSIVLDGVPARTPANHAIVVPSAALVRQ